MNAQLTAPASVTKPRSVSGYVSCRSPLARRRRQSRNQARRRVEEHTTKPLTAEQRARALPRRRSPLARFLSAIAAVVGSAAAHGLIVGIGVVTAALSIGSRGADDGPVVIEVQEREEPKPKPDPPPPEPEAPKAADVMAERVKPAAAAKVEEQPKEAPKAAPLRVVGLSLESTVGEGGDGPAFAVGTTRMGETAALAADPNKKAPDAPVVVSTPRAAPTAAGTSANRVASRIPTARVEYKLPKRRTPRMPPYPATLRSQGVEADVTVMVSLDDKGNVVDVKLISASPYPEFNEAARTTALSEKFEPAMRDGVPVPYTLSYTYRFRIEEK